MRSVFFACGLLLSGATAAFAQDVCHYSGKTYSSGASIKLGETLVTCGVRESGAYAWFIVSDEASKMSAHCLYAGQEYSHGSMLQVRDVGLVCGQGRWYKDKTEN